jgi:hypothetical protein
LSNKELNNEYVLLKKERIWKLKNIQQKK